MATPTDLRRLSNKIHIFSKDLPAESNEVSVFNSLVKPFLKENPDNIVDPVSGQPVGFSVNGDGKLVDANGVEYEQNPLSGDNDNRVADLYTTFFRNQQALFFQHENDNNTDDIEYFSQKLVVPRNSGNVNKIRLVDEDTVPYSNGSVEVRVTDERVQSDFFNDISQNVVVEFGADVSGITRSFQQRVVNHPLNIRNNFQCTENLTVEDGVTVQFDPDFNKNSLFSATPAEQQVDVVNNSTNARKLVWSSIPEENVLQTYYNVNYDPTGITNDVSGQSLNVKYGVFKCHFNDASSNVVPTLKDGANNVIPNDASGYNALPFVNATSGENDLYLERTPDYWMGVADEFLAVNEPKIVDDFEVSVYVGDHVDLASVKTDLSGLENGGYFLREDFADALNEVENMTMDVSGLLDAVEYVTSGAVNHDIRIDVSCNKLILQSGSPALEIIDGSGLSLIYERNERLPLADISSNLVVDIDSLSQPRVVLHDADTDAVESSHIAGTNKVQELSGAFVTKVLYHSDTDAERAALSGQNYLQGADIVDEFPTHNLSFEYPETTGSRPDASRVKHNSSYRALSNNVELHYMHEVNPLYSPVPSFNVVSGLDSTSVDAAIVKIETTVNLADESPVYNAAGEDMGRSALLDISGNTDQRIMASVIGSEIPNIDAFQDVRLDFDVRSISDVLANHFSTDIPANTLLKSTSESKFMNYDNGLVASQVKSLYGTPGSINIKVYWNRESTDPSRVLEHIPRQVVLDLNGKSLTLSQSAFNEANDVSGQFISLTENVYSTMDVNSLLQMKPGMDYPNTLYQNARLTKTTRMFAYSLFNIPAALPGFTDDVKLEIKNLIATITLYNIEYSKQSNPTEFDWIQQSPLEFAKWSLDGKDILHTRAMSLSNSVSLTSAHILDTVGEPTTYLNFNLNYDADAFASLNVSAKKKTGEDTWVEIANRIMDHRSDTASYVMNVSTGCLKVQMYAGLDVVLTPGDDYFVNLNVSQVAGENITMRGRIYDFTGASTLTNYPKALVDGSNLVSIAQLNTMGAATSRPVTVTYTLSGGSAASYNASTSKTVVYRIKDDTTGFDTTISSDVFFLSDMILNYVRHPVVVYDGLAQTLPLDSAYHNLKSAANADSNGIMVKLGADDDDKTAYYAYSEANVAQPYVLKLQKDHIEISHHGAQITVADEELKTSHTYYAPVEQTWGVNSGYYRGYKTQVSTYNRLPSTVLAHVTDDNGNVWSQLFTDIHNEKELILDNMSKAPGSSFDLGISLTMKFSQLLWQGEVTPHAPHFITLTPTSVVIKVSNVNYDLSMFQLGAPTLTSGAGPAVAYYKSNLKNLLVDATSSLTKALRLRAERAILETKSYKSGPLHLNFKYNQAPLEIQFSPFSANVADVADITTPVASRTYANYGDDNQIGAALEQLYDQALFRDSGLQINNVFIIQRDFSRNFNIDTFTTYVTCAPPQWSVSLFPYNTPVPFNRNDVQKRHYYNIVPQLNDGAYIGSNSFFGATSTIASNEHKAEPRMVVDRRRSMVLTPVELRADSNNEQKVIKMKENKISIWERRENPNNTIHVWTGYLSGLLNSAGNRLRMSDDDLHLFGNNNENNTSFSHPNYPVRIFDDVNNVFEFKFKQSLSEVINLSDVNISGVSDENEDIYNLKLRIENVQVYALNKQISDTYEWADLISSTKQGGIASDAYTSINTSVGALKEGIFSVSGVEYYKFNLYPEKSMRPWFFWQASNQIAYRLRCHNISIQSKEDDASNLQVYLSFSPSSEFHQMNLNAASPSWSPVPTSDIIYKVVSSGNNLSLEFTVVTGKNTWNNLLDRILPTPNHNKLLLILAEDIMEVKDAAGNTLMVINSAGQLSTHSVNLVSQQTYSLVNGMAVTNPNLISNHDVVNSFSHFANNVSS